MIAQYTQAGLVSELKRLATPASVDSIPSSAMQEDHVAMGWHAARKRSIDGLTRVLAIEILTAARPWICGHHSRPRLPPVQSSLLPSHGVAGPGPDRHLSPDRCCSRSPSRRDRRRRG